MASQEKHQEQYDDIELPQSIVDCFARFLVPEIRKLYASEEGKEVLEEWKRSILRKTRSEVVTVKLVVVKGGTSDAVLSFMLLTL